MILVHKRSGNELRVSEGRRRAKTRKDVLNYSVLKTVGTSFEENLNLVCQTFPNSEHAVRTNTRVLSLLR